MYELTVAFLNWYPAVIISLLYLLKPISEMISSGPTLLQTVQKCYLLQK